MSCNSRVSLSSTLRRMGLARPPRPSTSRLALVVSSTSRCIGLNRAPSSHVLCSRVRTLSVSILSQERRTFLAVGTLGRLLAKSSSPGLAFISLFRSPASLRWLRPHCRDGSTSCTGCPAAQITSPVRSLRRLPVHAHAVIRATLRPHANRLGLPPPALLVSCICQPCFMLDRPWAPYLQRFLPANRR